MLCPVLLYYLKFERSIFMIYDIINYNTTIINNKKKKKLTIRST